MKVFQKSILTMVGLMMLAGCGSTTSENGSIKPHKIDRYDFTDNNKSSAYLYLFNSSDHYNLMISSYKDSYINKHDQLFIDLDRSSKSGYTPYDDGVGAEYLLEDRNLFKYTGAGGLDWSWQYVESFKGGISAIIPFEYLLNDESFDAQGVILNENWDSRFASEKYRFIKTINNNENRVVFDEEYYFSVSNDIKNYYFRLIYTPSEHLQFWIDSDNNTSTGYGNGYDYLIEDRVLSKFDGVDTSSDWKWKKMDDIYYEVARNSHAIVPKDLTKDWSRKIKVYAVGLDKDWTELMDTEAYLYDINGSSPSTQLP